MAGISFLRHLRPALRGISSARTRSVPPRPRTGARCIAHVAGDLGMEKEPADKEQTSRLLKKPMAVDFKRSIEDMIFDCLSDDDGTVSISRFLDVVRETGLRTSDPRLRETMTNFKVVHQRQREQKERGSNSVDRPTFKTCVQENVVLIGRAFRNHFIIPEFTRLRRQVDQMFWECKTNTRGKVADYIPQLARSSPDSWGVAVCTIDGQRHSIGDVEIPFTIQSGSKPLTYALCLQELGPDIVHQYIGQEPSGVSFNDLSLNRMNRPHNPMINSGAISCAALVKSGLKLPDRFDYIHKQYKRLAGGEYVGFSNATFLSERESAYRNFALAYYMKENKCFPEGTNLSEIMDFYFQLCSCEINCESGSVIAATLANGGICPTTGDRVLDASQVRSTLSLMHSCGMYDYSGQFAFRVGLPGKSGVSGNVFLVVPNVMGVCLWSPNLDPLGNSVRGLQFIESMVEYYNFHNYDSLQHNPDKVDPRRKDLEYKAHDIVSILFSAYNGDVTAIRRYSASGVDMSQADYDGRTALHLAAAEGHLAVVKFLVEKCRVPSQPKDRWGFTPSDDSERFGHEKVSEYLRSLSNPPTGGADGGSMRKDQGSTKKDEGSMRKDEGSTKKDQGSTRKDEGSTTKDEGSTRKDQGSLVKDQGSIIKDEG